MYCQKSLVFFLVLFFLFCLTLAGNVPYEFQTVSKPGIADTYLILPSYVLLNNESYFDWEDIQDFFRSAVNPRIEKNIVMSSIEMITSQGTAKLLFHDNIVLWDSMRIRINNPLIIREGRYFIHSGVIGEIAQKSGVFNMRRLDGIPGPITMASKDEEEEQIADMRVIPLAPDIKDIQVGVLINFAPEISGQIKASIEENIKNSLNDFFSTVGAIHYFPSEGPLTLAENINRRDLDCFLYLHFAAPHQSLDKTARIFYITGEVHPLNIDRRRTTAGYEYRTTFKSYEAYNKNLAYQLEESLNNLTEMRVIGSGQGMIRILQYLSLPSCIIEFYNLNLEDEQNFFSQREQINSLARALKSGVEKFVD